MYFVVRWNPTLLIKLQCLAVGGLMGRKCHFGATVFYAVWDSLKWCEVEAIWPIWKKLNQWPRNDADGCPAPNHGVDLHIFIKHKNRYASPRVFILKYPNHKFKQVVDHFSSVDIEPQSWIDLFSNTNTSLFYPCMVQSLAYKATA